MRLLCLVMIVLWTGAVKAQDTELNAAGMRYVFEQWAQEVGADEISLVSLHNGTVAGTPLNPDRPVELASLSKAITAICVAQLIEEGVWSARTTSAQVLGEGPQEITVAQLVTHTSGISPDSTQGLLWLLRDMHAPLGARVTATALARTPDETLGYFYSNENYAILGEMIEAALGQSYEQACAGRALAPAGITTAEPSRTVAGTLAWGGWQMSVHDYARFHQHWFGPDGPYGAGAPEALRIDLGDGAFYGLGMFERPWNEDRNFWHFGSWCMPFRINAGTFAVMWRGAWSAVAAYDVCLEEEAMIKLDRALARAAFAR
jgi:CubicO group peptidase (beta-lactamase class C family)